MLLEGEAAPEVKNMSCKNVKNNIYYSICDIFRNGELNPGFLGSLFYSRKLKARCPSH